jgi:hypothetical protein
MRHFLARLMLARILPQSCPYEDFFAAGPPSAAVTGLVAAPLGAGRSSAQS